MKPSFMKLSSTLLLAILVGLCLIPQLQAQNATDTSQSSLAITGVAELGFLSVMDHKVQFSNSGTDFDYRKDGGQDVLFPVSRLALELEFNKYNTLVFLYQPLKIESRVLLQEDLWVDDMLFRAGSNVHLLYNFPFYRISYLRELLKENERWSLQLGGSLQLRNATISFASGDGERFRTNRDVGPVPILKVRSRVDVSERCFMELEADGMYAPISYLNGSDNEVVGAILDASYRAGLDVTPEVTTFLNARYLGGGAVGTSEPDGPGDGYVRNWLHFATVTAGFSYSFR